MIQERGLKTKLINNIYYIIYNRWFIMCSSGGPMADIDLKKLKTKKYHCKDCGNSFKGLGKKVVCPSCQSDNVEIAE